MSRLAALAFAATLLLAPATFAQTTQIRVLRPDTQVAPSPSQLPRFGFESYNIAGYGERVTRVRQFGLAADMGLEPGDVILRMNHFNLDYHGAWNDALREALWNHNGRVRLQIRDVRTGRVVERQVFVGGGPVGPITSKSHNRDVHDHYDHHDAHHSHRDNRMGNGGRRGNDGFRGPGVEHRGSNLN
jgi:hypothetical protein